MTLDALAPNPKNPRKPWRVDQVDAFRRSLQEFGDLSGIILNRRTGHLVGGHKRIEVFSQAADAQVVKTDQREDATGTLAFGYVQVDGTRFAYREVDWSEAKETAANLAANRWAAEWAWEGVSEALKGLADTYDLALTGFTPEEIEPLQAAEWAPPPIDEDGVRPGTSIHLTPEQMAVFRQAKAKMAEVGISDGRAVELLSADYLAGS